MGWGKGVLSGKLGLRPALADIPFQLSGLSSKMLGGGRSSASEMLCWRGTHPRPSLACDLWTSAICAASCAYNLMIGFSKYRMDSGADQSLAFLITSWTTQRM